MRCLIAKKGMRGIIIDPADDNTRKGLEKETNLKIVPLQNEETFAPLHQSVRMSDETRSMIAAMKKVENNV